MFLRNVEVGQTVCVKLRNTGRSWTLGCYALGITPRNCAGLILGPFVVEAVWDGECGYIETTDGLGRPRVFCERDWRVFGHIVFEEYVEGLARRYGPPRDPDDDDAIYNYRRIT